ncbi:XdhC family protein [Jiangella alba]|uniref:Xanthine dehydrogenase accessory factor n=1 Tax=Jiangella alba TaxID=561176 RepID=A0A1H5M2B8_9ACTN|nr:XdhC family protein [Jiangella alba]SEE83463.1 xanthine dehydrogenase accessory factor [Jiangella alba]
MTTAIDDRAGELLAGRIPFVHATVVRAQVPASARAGDDAIILADGSIEGFVGGQCTESSVRAAALGAMRDGESVLLRVLPENAGEFPEAPGARVVVNPCLSGGAMEIFLQPRLPRPLVQVVGGSPIAAALVELGAPLGFDVVREAPPLPPAAVVIASHGGDEPAAIRAALDAGVGWIGLVASPRRGAGVLAELTLTEEERARISTPAGLDIGARTAAEIALSILAEIVREARAGRLPVAEPGEAPARPGEAVDPVCGMTVLVGPDTPHLVVDGEDVWFCGPGCRDRYARTAGR